MSRAVRHVSNDAGYSTAGTRRDSWTRDSGGAVISISEFEAATGLPLEARTSRWASECDEAFVRYFVSSHRYLDAEHLRCAMAIVSSVDSMDVRRVVGSYLEGGSIDVEASAAAYFVRQKAHGYIAHLPW